MFFRIPQNVTFCEKSFSELLSLYFPAYIADLLLQSYNLFPQYFLFGISFFIRKITHLNRDISSLTQFGDHSPSLSFIKTLQEVEFNFVTTDQNNKIWIFFIYSPAKNFADNFNFFISWLIRYSFKNNYRDIFFEERQGITPFHSLILFAYIYLFISLAFILIYIDAELLYFHSFIYFALWLCIFGICCCNLNFR